MKFNSHHHYSYFDYYDLYNFETDSVVKRFIKVNLDFFLSKC